MAQWIGFERSARPRETAELLLAPASGGETPRGEPSHAKAMATWYGAHIAQAANSEGGPDGEALVLELWELLALRGSDVGRLGAVATRLLQMPWHQHLREPLEAHGYDSRSGSFPRGPAPGLLQELTRIGAGANPMPFAVPTVRGCRLQARQRVRTTGAEVTLEHVLATSDGRGYGLIKNLQTCIYGRVRHGVELERIAPEEQSGGLFGGIQRTLGGQQPVQWRATERQVAVKCIERSKYEQHVARHRGQLNEDPIKEVAVMEYICSKGGAPYVLPLLATYADEQTVYVILPFCPNGDLFGVVERDGGLQEAMAATYMGQIVKGLEHLHDMGLAHHDMSLENLMVDDAKRAIIIDFGMAVKAAPTFTDFWGGGHDRLSAGRSYRAVPLAPRRGWPGRCGKLLYMAPELFDCRASFDVFAADVWALGIILFLLLTGMPPWDAATGPVATDLRFVYVRDGRLRDLLNTWNITLSEHAPDVLQRLLTADPRQRLTIPELKAHPWWRQHARYVDAA